jgi:hypothetical protein
MTQRLVELLKKRKETGGMVMTRSSTEHQETIAAFLEAGAVHAVSKVETPGVARNSRYTTTFHREIFTLRDGRNIMVAWIEL